MYYVQYGKLTTDIEYFNIKGERFWKIKSNEYPYVSSRGKIILFLVADLSRVRVTDFNGNETGIKSISGRFCTSICFSSQNDILQSGFSTAATMFLTKKALLCFRERPAKAVS